MNSQTTVNASVNEGLLDDRELDAAAGGVLWFFVAGAVVGWEVWDAITGDTRKAEAPTKKSK